ncbi:MAG TPA: peptidylprolyl isomerase [Candidatus Omnitrophica bacterium]|nr:peptidylprolyl isomerase [Candidatus Omnitrophota bacterium]
MKPANLNVLASLVLLFGFPLVSDSRLVEAEEPSAQEPAERLAIAENMAVQMEYALTADGQAVDASPAGEPFRYTHGRGQIIPGLERQLAGLHVGDAREITVSPEEGYGPVDPEAVVEIPREQLPATVTPEAGMSLSGVDPEGRPFRARIKELRDTTVTLDLNHPLAGKTLLFKVNIVDIAPSP